ncbi:hypothetical protein ASF49_08250 [Methylobacterium sp. Leaf104]|uniref:hypothetical protein n=1 Tax=Methylobacterium TaxID=407 RepID=UPI0006FB1CBF|nr:MULTISPECIES: hypothetical protein [Methylobacterium]KQP33848.1 hypothetical protein ASF49_08250 [Methylobacterium sp. Leaf104]MCI9879582.1 hypothetical protein [Methylobacterium goesingense]
MLFPSTLGPTGARVPTEAEAKVFARRPLHCRATGASLSYPQRKVLSLATSDLLGFPVWAIAQLEGMTKVEVLAHARALHVRGLVHLDRVDGEAHLFPCPLGLRVKNRARHVAKALGHGA